MPKVSKATAGNVQDIGVGEVWEDEVEGYQISFLELREDNDLAALLKGLPDDRCTCPHWGYVTAGRVTFTFADHAEVFEAGDAFYVPAGHSPAASAGSVFVLISPADQVAEVDAVIQRNLAAMQTA